MASQNVFNRAWVTIKASRAWHFMARWAYGAALFGLIIAAIFVVLWLVVRALNAPSLPISPGAVAITVTVVFLLFGLALMIAFFLLFRGLNADADQLKRVINYCYAYIVFALSAGVIPFVVLPSLPASVYDAMTRSPIGIVIGCSVPPYIETVTGERGARPGDAGTPEATKGDSTVRTAPRIDDRFVPKELRCGANTDQWVVNVGGAIAPRAEGEVTSLRIVQITGGLVVPLYAIVLSLMGAAVSMTRRVPEYQRRATPGDPDSISYDKAREMLVFQIMQVTSAPLIALTIYYLVDPGSRASTIVLSFAAGFSSETVLLVIRAALEKLQPGQAGQPPANAITVAPTRLDFGAVPVNQSSKRPVVLNNPGPVTLTVHSVQSSASEFSAVTQMPLSVAAHSSGTIDLEFNPAAIGVRQALVQIFDNGNSSPRTVAVVGKGT
jgi:hypothetical protein